MTNYSKWDKFDPDLVCKEIEVKQDIESSKKAKKKAFTNDATENEQNILNSKKVAEALQSQSAVAELKAKGIGGRRRRDKSASTSDTFKKVEVPAVPLTKQKTTAERISAITDFLYKLLKQVESLRSCTEKKSLHDSGYKQAIYCLQDIRTFSRIKNATVLATLHASSSSALEAGAAMKIMEDLNESEDFLIDQTVNCLSLFALSRGEYALATDTSRYVIKRQQSSVDAGVWVMRGLAFAAVGAPYLARVHFSSAQSVNAEYGGLKEGLLILETAATIHAQRAFRCNKTELVTRELARSLQNFFRPRVHLLKEVADLAVVTIEEVHNFLAEGAVWDLDITAIFGTPMHTSSVPGEVAAVHQETAIYMEENTMSAHTPSAACTGLNVTIQDIIQVLQRNINEDSSTNSMTSPYSSLRIALRELQYKQTTELLLVLILLQALRKLFSEAQLLFLESYYQGAEMKYHATILLIQSCIKVVHEYKQLQHTASENNPFPVEKITCYLDKLSSACYLNIAVALAHRTISIHNRMSNILSSDHAKHTKSIEFVPITVHDLVSSSSVLRTPLDWCEEGLKKHDSVIGRLRRLFVLEKMYHFIEALQECDHIDEMLTVRENLEEDYVFPSVSGQQSLSQKYLSGFALPMPVLSVLATNAIVLDSTQDGANILKQPSSVDPLEMELDFMSQTETVHTGLKIECCNETINTTATTTGSGMEATLAVWKNYIQKQRQRLQYLAQKFAIV